VQGLTIRASHV
jgi:hypothetical protein